MDNPTPQQLNACRRIQAGLMKIFEAQQRINAIITEHDLEATFGVTRLPAHHLSITMGSLEEALRRNESFQIRRAA